MTSLRFSLAASLLLSSLLLVACRDDSAQQADKPTAEDSAKTVLLPMQAERAPGYDSANAGTFRKIVYREYAGRALDIPKKTADSILQSVIMTAKPGEKVEDRIQSAMKTHLDRQDSVARAELAGKYKISVDSVQAILEMGKAEKW
jgi:hypothetical protein